MKPEEERSNKMKHLEKCWNFLYILPPLITSLLSSSKPSEWSEIDDDVFGLILQRLSLTDYLRTQVVCKNWRSIVLRLIDIKCCPPLPGKLPLVFLQTINDPKHFSLFNLSTKMVSPCSGISTQFDCCYGTVEGWLIMVEDQAYSNSKCIRSIFFFNPITKARVLMPSKLQCEGKVTKVVASAKPSDPNCIVVCLFLNTSMIAFSGISDDSWTFIKGSLNESIIFNEIEILDGKLYALDNLMFDSVFVCDLQNKPVNPKLLAVKHHSAIAVDWYERNVSYFRFLAVDSSSGELLLIHMVYKSISYGDNLWENNNRNMFAPMFIETRAYKLSMMTTGDEVEWIEVKNLGNRMLFVGERKSLVVSNVGDLRGPQDLMKGKCIHFVCRVRNIGELEHKNGIWFMPSCW